MFDTRGHFIPGQDLSFFAYPPSNFYQLNLQSTRDIIHSIARLYSIDRLSLSSSFDQLHSNITEDHSLASCLSGPHLPFYLPASDITDVGTRLVEEVLPILSNEFTSTDLDAHFKAVIQDKKQLPNRLQPYPGTRYDELLKANSNSPVVGFFFPLAFNQFSVSSQRKAFSLIQSNLSITLSGPLEICSALSASPRLLMHTESYSPILCMSGVQHVDQRLTCCLKSYGPHLEFWVLSNILLPGVEQVSEQWSGGITIYMKMPLP